MSEKGSPLPGVAEEVDGATDEEDEVFTAKEENKWTESQYNYPDAVPVPASLPVDQPQPYKPVVPADTEGASDNCGTILKILSILMIILFFPLSLFFSLEMVKEYERAVIFRLGRILHGGAKGPGLFFVYPCLDTIEKVDLRTKSVDIKPQEILTKDHVTVAVDAVMYVKVVEPILSVTMVEDVMGSSKLLAATTLRNVLGTHDMTEVLSRRDNINETIKQILDEATDPWGVVVERVEIIDVRLPDMLQRTMAAEAEATREAKAKVIAAEGEQKAARALKEAADIMAESPAALQIRYLQTLNTVASEKNCTFVFPLPMELLRGMQPPYPPPGQYPFPPTGQYPYPLPGQYPYQLEQQPFQQPGQPSLHQPGQPSLHQPGQPSLQQTTQSDLQQLVQSNLQEPVQSNLQQPVQPDLQQLVQPNLQPEQQPVQPGTS